MDDKVYTNRDEYFQDHPEEEAAYYDDMAELFGHEEPIEFPEDW